VREYFPTSCTKDVDVRLESRKMEQTRLRWSTWKMSTTVNGQMQVRSLGRRMLREKVDVRDESARCDWVGREKLYLTAAWKSVEKEHQVAKAHFNSAASGSADNALPAV
jgi:hypothetical protein